MSGAPEQCEISRGAHQVRQARTGRFVISEATYHPGVEIPPHYHDCPCITFVLDGGFVEKIAGTERQVDAQTLLIRPPAEIHSDEIAATGVRSVHIELVGPADDAASPITAALSRPVMRKAATTTAIAADILRELKLAEPMSELALEGLALQLIAEGGRGSLGGSANNNRCNRARPSWLDRVVEYLCDSIADRPTLSRAARLAEVHPSHLSRVFRQHFGCSIGQYVRQLRVEQARALLRESSIPISAIAHTCGFSDQSHLTNVFKSVTGQSPASYRRSHSAR